MFVYLKGAPQSAGYFGHGMETYDAQVRPFWVSEVNTKSGGSVDVMQKAADYVKGLRQSRAASESNWHFCRRIPRPRCARYFRMPNSRTRCSFLAAAGHKTPAELEKLRLASNSIDSMLAVIQSHGEGSTKAELAEALRREETSRGLTFDYCLITAGSSLNRAPSDQRWGKGDPLSVDSGGNYHGYIGDLARMGIVGDPDFELQDLLAEIEATQQAAFATNQTRRQRRRDLCGSRTDHQKI